MVFVAVSFIVVYSCLAKLSCFY